MAKGSYSVGYNPDGTQMTPEEEAETLATINAMKGLDPKTEKEVNITNVETPTQTVSDRQNKLGNSRWVTQTFALTSAFAASLGSKPTRMYDQSEFKFYDTTPGGYRAINPAPQMTRHADVKRRNRNSGSRGLGRYYSEAIDDASQVIHLRMGVPEPNSLTGFLARAYEPSAGKLARTGEGTSFLAAVTDLVFNVLLLPFVPFIQGWRSVKSLLTDAPNNKFYYSKPAMPLYFNAVNMMLIKLAVDMKLIGGAKPVEGEKPKPVSTQDAVPDKETYNAAFKVDSILSDKDRRLLNGMFPDIFDEEFGFDIRAMATRYQRLANADYEAQAKIVEKIGDPNEYRRALMDYLVTEQIVDDNGDRRIGPYLEAYLEAGLGKGGEAPDITTEAIQGLDIKSDALRDELDEAYKSSTDKRSDYGTWWSSSWEFLKAELRDGSQWVSIRVNHTGTSSASFGNSSDESGLAASINSASASAQATKFNFAGGNVGDGVFADIAESALGAVTSVVSQASASIGAGAIGAMLGGGRLDIPKYWSNSSATLPGGSYQVQLRTPYGNKVSIFKDIYIPQCMLMCMALPKAAGPSAYTSPFMIEIFDTGRWQSCLALMENLSIERGTGNLGWSKEGYPLGVDISFDIVDLTTIMAMPITGQSFSFNDRSPYLDYLAAMANKHPLDQITVSGRFNNKRAVAAANMRSTFSASNMASAAADTWAGRLVRGLSRSVTL